MSGMFLFERMIDQGRKLLDSKNYRRGAVYKTDAGNLKGQ